MSPTKLIIIGAKGRMGQSLVSCAVRNSEFQIAGEINRGDDLRKTIASSDVVIDFSSHTGTLPTATVCAEYKKPLVIGTTGHSNEELASVKALGSKIPIVISSNYSSGVNTLFWLTRK